MIEWYQAVLLALMQGLTEFLPISSSAHLVIPSLLLGWPDQGLAFDVAEHVGTLTAVLFYYRGDLVLMADRWFRSVWLHGCTVNADRSKTDLHRVPAGICRQGTNVACPHLVAGCAR